jgi:hypothetical protein
VSDRAVRAAVHLHSDWSDDGSWPIERIVQAFSRRHYRVLVMTEHSRGWTDDIYRRYTECCEHVSTPDLLVVPGIEYNDPDNRIHVQVWGDVPFFGSAPSVGDLLHHVTASQGVAVLAHPWRREAWRHIEPEWLDHFSGIELWNRKYDGWAPSEAAADLIDRAGISAFAGLDFHTARQFFPLSLNLDLGSDANSGPTTEAVLRSLRTGRFVAQFMGRDIAAVATGVPRRVAGGAESVRRVLARGARTSQKALARGRT